MTEDLRIPKKQIEFTGKLFDYKEFRKYSEVFIETGCAAGDGVQRAVDAKFSLVTSIEAADKWFNICYERFKNLFSTVRIVKGVSTDVLGTVLSAHSYLNKEKPVVIYLDAHSSGDTSFGHKECIAGEPEFQQDNIIKQELNIILSNYNKHIICIDDVNGLSDGHAEEYMELCLQYNRDYKFQFWDEQLDSKGPRYKDKILTAIL